jgi:hypothetical protein
MDDLYECDFYRWATGQAAVMRDKRFELEALGIDWVNVAEELDTLGRSEKRELRSRLGVLLLHLLKWLHQPMHQGSSWETDYRNPPGGCRQVAVRHPEPEAPSRPNHASRSQGRTPGRCCRNRLIG